MVGSQPATTTIKKQVAKPPGQQKAEVARKVTQDVVMQSDAPQAAEQDALNVSAPEDSGPDEEGEEEMEQEYLDENSEDDEDASQMGGEQSKKVRDKLATISIPFEGENNPIVFSYHYKYEKYVRDNNLIDVSKNLEKKTLLTIFSYLCF